MCLYFHYRTERLSLNNSNDTTLYQSATDNLNETEQFEKSEELYTTAADNSNPLEINHSELYHSTVQELYVNPSIVFFHSIII